MALELGGVGLKVAVDRRSDEGGGTGSDQFFRQVLIPEETSIGLGDTVGKLSLQGIGQVVGVVERKEQRGQLQVLLQKRQVAGLLGILLGKALIAQREDLVGDDPGDFLAQGGSRDLVLVDQNKVLVDSEANGSQNRRNCGSLPLGSDIWRRRGNRGSLGIDQQVLVGGWQKEHVQAVGTDKVC